MTTSTPEMDGSERERADESTPEVEAVGEPDLDLGDLLERFAEVESQLQEMAEERDKAPKMTIVAVNGTLDMAYPTLILANMAGAFDWDVTVFASFWALDMLHEEKSRNLKMSSLGNPAMPMPNLLGVLPGGDRLTTTMMKRRMKKMGVENVRDLVESAIDNGVEFQACQMTADLMGYEDEDFVEGVTTGVGAGTALFAMADGDVQLVI